MQDILERRPVEIAAIRSAVPGWGYWCLADPKISLASLASIFLGACGAAAQGSLSWVWLTLTVIGILSIEIAKNASGEIVDYDSGADLGVTEEDRTPFSGGKRVLVDGLLTRSQTSGIAATHYLLAVIVGSAIVLMREPRIAWLGLVGVACAYFYHSRPLRLSYRGWGELAVALRYGPLIALGTALVQRGQWISDVFWASIALGLLIAGFLWINEIPDAEADRLDGKRTLVVRLGRRRAGRWLFGLTVLVSAAIALPPAWGASPGLWLGAVSLPPAFWAAVRAWRFSADTSRLIPAQRLMLASFVLHGLGSGIGLLLME